MRSVGLAVALVIGCGGGPVAAPAAPVRAPAAAVIAPGSEPIGLVPGETMAFEVKIAGLAAGEAQLAVGELGEFQGHRAVVVKSRAETVGVVAIARHIIDEATTVIDFDSGRPLTLDTVFEQNDERATASATFTGNVAEITYHPAGGKPARTQKVDFGTTVLDAHAAMAQLRGWRPTRGARRTVFVVSGRRPWRIDVTAVGVVAEPHRERARRPRRRRRQVVLGVIGLAG
ncbi:MAG TPA: DUF3108 domain-containing protein, partial [Kofleriaceae bacterium]